DDQPGRRSGDGAANQGSRARGVDQPVVLASTNCGTSAARSSATNGGGGSGIASPPGGASRWVTPDSTSANGQPSASASAPSVDGRSPTTSPDEPNRARIRSTIGRSGFPATSGERPEAVATAAAIAPDPGIMPPGTG